MNALTIYKDFDGLQRAAMALQKSGYFQDVKTEAQAIVKVMAGSELGLPPFASMTGIHIIQGKPVLGAADMYERSGTPFARRRMLETAEYAEKLQAEFDAQEAWKHQPRKRVVLLQTTDRREIDPDFCPHLNTVMNTVGNDDEPYTQCLDCGWVYRDDYTWGPAELPECDDDPNMFGELL